MLNETTENFDVNSSFKFILTRSKENNLQPASKEIKELTEFNSIMETQSTCEDNILTNNVKTAITENFNIKEPLQKQLKIEEIIPFQAIQKQISQENCPDKNFNIYDLQAYFQRQAELAKQKRQIKKVSKLSNIEENTVIPTKKAKIETNRFYKLPNKNLKCSTVKVKTNFTKAVADTSRATVKEFIPMECKIKENAMSDNEINHSGSEYFPSDEEKFEQRRCISKKKNINLKHKQSSIKRILDDGDEQIYQERIRRNKNMKNEPVHMVDNLFKVPQSIWKRLYRYQKTSVQWLWQLHNRSLGGLLGDEMGLGKTIQVIAFLVGLDYSDLLSDEGRFRGLGPTLIVCPATLMEQWVKHLHDWWPIFRVILLHQCGTFDVDPESLINSLATGCILITSYSGMLKHKDLLINSQWHYVILDEGHKIRNPQAKISKAVKELSTPHRLLLTGSPMQNSLKELWSLFDFILPGKLGTLPVFLEHCAAPIIRGGYTNATALQQATALQVASMLKDIITPYLLRRTKADLKYDINLPEKNEQVLFCSLTEEQRKLYKKYLSSNDVSFVLHEKYSFQDTGKYRARLLIALSALRKICNHPDLYLYTNEIDSDADIDLKEEDLEKFGYWKRAGKMVVVQSLLKIWKKQGHRVLLFTQGRQMMHILESLLQRKNYSYLRMDGTTPMSQRQIIIRTFNSTTSYFIFLLTTRVGGLGVNLTGANRVVIYDPDWNPATDAQARERAWRIGQDKNVTIYRLITAGTIEEKIYHRQIFKLLLSNKVLEDPRQRRIFKPTDLVELFNLNEPINGESSESDQLFKDSKLTLTSMKFSTNKIKKMKKLALMLSKNISKCVTINDITKDGNVKDNLHINQKDNIKVSNEIKPTTLRNYKSDKTKEQMSVEESLYDVENNDTIDVRMNNINEIKLQEKECHRKKHKKKKLRIRKDNVSALFEGEQVSCLIGRRLVKSRIEKSAQDSDDNYVLKKLFANATVSSAFEHAAVLSNANQNTIDETTLKRVARDTARESMEFVCKSRKWCFIPKWNK